MCVDNAFNASLTGAIETICYDVGETIRQAGGQNKSYLGAKPRFSRNETAKEKHV
nr:hypothetical protein [Rhizobium leguminosarum]